MKGWFSLCNLADEEKLCVRSEISVLRAYSRQTARHRRLLSLWLCSAEPVAMVSPAWHSGSSGGVTAGEGGGGGALCCWCAKGHGPLLATGHPTDMSPKPRAHLITAALPRPGHIALLLHLDNFCIRYLFDSRPVYFYFFCFSVFFPPPSHTMSPILIAAQ